MANGIGKKAVKETYANIAYGDVTMSAANTLTFAQIQLAVGIFQGVGMILHRILWQPSITALREIVAATDSLYMALCTSNLLAQIHDVVDPAIVAYRAIVGIAANIETREIPIVSDFTMLPGGGKLLPANPIHLAAFTAGFAAAARVRAQLDFTFVELSDRDYLELIQAQFPVNL